MDLVCQNKEKQTLLPRAQILLEAWQNYAKKTGGIPPRQDISPRDLKKILPYIIMAENLDPETVMVTLVGTGIVLRNGIDFTGVNWLTYISEAERNFFLDLQFPKFETPCGIWYKAATTPKSKLKTFYIESLTLPFIKKGDIKGSISVDDEIGAEDIPKQEGWGTGNYDILDMKLVDIGFGLPEKVYNFPLPLPQNN